MHNFHTGILIGLGITPSKLNPYIRKSGMSRSEYSQLLQGTPGHSATLHHTQSTPSQSALSALECTWVAGVVVSFLSVIFLVSWCRFGAVLPLTLQDYMLNVPITTFLLIKEWQRWSRQNIEIMTDNHVCNAVTDNESNSRVLPLCPGRDFHVALVLETKPFSRLFRCQDVPFKLRNTSRKLLASACTFDLSLGVMYNYVLYTDKQAHHERPQTP